MNASTMTDRSAEALLAIPLTEPERLFTHDAGQARQEFRALARVWHPDRCAQARATEVFQHLSRLYEAAIHKLRDGVWKTPGLLILRGCDGTEFRIHYRREREFELGKMFIGDQIVACLVGKEHGDLFQNALDMIGCLPCADPRMAREISYYLPEVIRHFEIEAHQVLILRKAPDLLLLRDVLERFAGQLDARHVAWILSSLLNLACYLDYARLAHNAISIDTYFISPQRHSGALLGGWWYATKQGERMRAAPTATIQYAPFEVLACPRGDQRTDLNLIRALGRELLGDITGMGLTPGSAVPWPLLDWLRLPAAGSALDDYRTWQSQILPDSFGERRFVKLDLTPQDLY
ncbi:MAG: J domain-containing protein [Gammaproteobacteria bacterium]|nr:J domain-containing protein [Gammaproteobacteria bacterium]